MLERKIENIFKVVWKVVKISKRNIENMFDICFSNENKTITLMLEKNKNISVRLHETIVKTPKETLKTRLKTWLATKNKTIALMLEKKSKIFLVYPSHFDLP